MCLNSLFIIDRERMPSWKVAGKIKIISFLFEKIVFIPIQSFIKPFMYVCVIVLKAYYFS